MAGTLSTAWNMKGGRFTAPANAAKVRIQLFDYMNTGWVVYDDVSLKRVSTYNLSYDEENRLTTVSGSATASFAYDGDGNRVKAVEGGVTTVYIGSHFEWTGSTSTMKKYYYAGSTRVAMRVGSTLYYLLGDHLGSTSITTDSSGSKVAEVRYMPWGSDRFTSGSVPTDFRFTGQRRDSYINLMWYNSRWYDPALGRWIQPDSIVPESVQGVQAWDRFAYANNNAVRYTDPTGHRIDCAIGEENCEAGEYVEPGMDDAERDIGNEVGDAFSSVALYADVIAFVINIYQATLVDFLGGTLIVLGTIVGPEGPTDGIIATLKLDYTVSSNTTIGIAENVLGGIAFGATAIADIAYGNTDLANVGVDTLVSARSAVLGLFPEVNIDIVVSGYQLFYDLGRRDGNLPGGSVPWSWDNINTVISSYWPDIVH